MVNSDGLDGESLSLEEILKLDFFQGTDSEFKRKLHIGFGIRPPSRRKNDANDPPPKPIQAAVKRHYQSGDVICKAGEYGSTAFLILSGTAVAEVPATTTPAGIRGRNSGALQRLGSMFKRRTRAAHAEDPSAADLGERSAFAAVSCDRPPPSGHLGPGDFFGIDTCINYYPREATVRAEQNCVVLELLRSLVDSVRSLGDFADRLTTAYRENAIRTQIALAALFRGLDDEQLKQLVAASTLLTNDSSEIRKGVVYKEGDIADALFLVRAGNIRLSRSTAEGEVVLSYLGRGSVFGFEGLVAADEDARPLVLRCASHPQEFSPVELAAGLSFGRNPTCDIVFPRDRRNIGRQHCYIERRDDQLVLVKGPTGSPTLLNGEEVSEALLVAGDQITIGDYMFTLGHADLETTVADAPPVRRATASGLDNFEIIKIDRKLLKRLAHQNEIVSANLGAAARSLRTAAAPERQANTAVRNDLLRLDLYNSQNTLLIDLERCTRCDECVRACADAHDGVARFTRDGPRFGKYLVTMACRSCTDPKCMIGCPVGSIRRESSLEIRIEDWCIGCQTCARQCPFGNINMVHREEPAAAASSPIDLFSGKMRAVVCDLCAGYDGPNCVHACPHDAAIRVNPGAYLAPEDLR